MNGAIPTAHHNADEFREALTHTAAITGFSPRLIEKDYFCTLLLHDFGSQFDTGLIFKGGTSLSKVHAGFYRLSEDLDFVISVDSGIQRRVRREKMESIKEMFATVSDRHPNFRIAGPLAANNENRQYQGQLAFSSPLTGQYETIFIDVSLREPVLTPTLRLPAKTLLRSPNSTDAFIAEPLVTVLSTIETYAEKLRAALSRREPKIRDFYDVAYAVRAGLIDSTDTELRRLVGQKLAIPGNDAIDLTPTKFETLSRQVSTELKDVLRPEDFAHFDLKVAFELVGQIASGLIGS